MLQFLKKLKLNTKLAPETVHKPPISILTKIYLWSFVDYQYLKKYFNIWNITLNYCFICKIISGLTLPGNGPGYSSIAHNLTLLFHSLKIINDSVPMIMLFKVLKYFSNCKQVFFYLLSCCNENSNQKNCYFYQKSWPTHWLLFLVKILVCGWNLDLLEVNGICI